MVIGEWNRSVWVSYAGVAASCVGIYFAAVEHNFPYAVICLIIAGLCDMLDGFVARTMKKRSATAKRFGIELDAVADVMDFIALPVVIIACMGVNIFEMIPLVIFAIFGLERLAHFNTSCATSDKPVKFYHGLPVTYTALIFPLAFLGFSLLVPSVLREMLLITVSIIGILNVLDIYVYKPKPWLYGVFFVLAIIVSIALVVAL
jgi:CDP-diacylglycerol--serine O-phosphatidyltransferase